MTTGREATNGSLVGRRLRLFWTARSPFARKVTMAAHELGIFDQLELTVAIVTPIQVDPVLAPYAPIGQIPVLVTPAGEAIYDSVVICDWLDATYGPGRLVPREDPARLDAKRREALGDGITDRAMKWLDEILRPEATQIPERIDAFRNRIARALTAVEEMVPDFSPSSVDIGDIALFTAIAYLDFRFGDFDWRKGHPALAGWHAAIAARPSAQATQYGGAVVRDLPATSAATG